MSVLTDKPPAGGLRNQDLLAKYHRDPDQQLQHEIVTQDKERVDNDRFSHKYGFNVPQGCVQNNQKRQKLYQSEVIHIGIVLKRDENSPVKSAAALPKTPSRKPPASQLPSRSIPAPKPPAANDRCRKSLAPQAPQPRTIGVENPRPDQHTESQTPRPQGPTTNHPPAPALKRVRPPSQGRTVGSRRKNRRPSKEAARRPKQPSQRSRPPKKPGVLKKQPSQKTSRPKKASGPKKPKTRPPKKNRKKSGRKKTEKNFNPILIPHSPVIFPHKPVNYQLSNC